MIMIDNREPRGIRPGCDTACMRYQIRHYCCLGALRAIVQCLGLKNEKTESTGYTYTKGPAEHREDHDNFYRIFMCNTRVVVCLNARHTLSVRLGTCIVGIAYPCVDMTGRELTLWLQKTVHYMCDTWTRVNL